MISTRPHQPQQAPHRTGSERTTATIVLLLVCAASALASPAPSAFPVVGTRAPDFTLTDQLDHRVQLSQFHGKLILLNFIYAHCVDVCPIVTANLVKVQRALIARGWWGKDVVFLSVTTDPVRDLPSVLRKYAEARGADSGSWHFLTGDVAAVRRVHKLYGITVQAATMGLQEHPLPTFVIDRKGVVLGAYGVALNPQDVVHDLEQLR